MTIRLTDLLLTYGILAVVDLRWKIVPDSILLSYFAGQLILGARFMTPEGLLYQIVTGGIFLLLALFLAWFSKGRMGMGDARLLGVTAMTAGWRFVFQTLIAAVFLSFLYSLWQIVIHKKSMQTEFPFVPFLAAAMVIESIGLLQYSR